MPTPAVEPAQITVYLVTDRHQTQGRRLEDVIEAALRGGIRAVQLREKDLPARDLLDLARRLREVTRRYAAALLINDRIDVALACDADGVHLPADSFSVPDARALLGRRYLIGVSTHSIAEVDRAAAAGADFVVFGPVFHTPSKEAYGAPLGVDALARAVACTRVPVIGVGGVTAERSADLRAHGAAGVAVIRAVLAAADPERAARDLLAAYGPPAQ